VSYIPAVDNKEHSKDLTGPISRPQLEAVIRRAAELYAAEADADDGVSETELIRIASELGLPSRLVRQALYETPGTLAEPSLADRICGPAQLSVARVVPNEPGLTFERLEEYLVTREYFQVTRRQPGRAWFLPADDLVSRIIRSVTKPSNRHLLTRARGVALTVHPLEEDRAHVRLDLNFASMRKDLLIMGGVIGGGPVGLTLGAIAAAAIDSIIAGPLGPAGIFGAIGAGMIASGSAGLAIAAASFRRQRKAAGHEVEGLLDRIETGERLDPPLPPWRRRLQKHLRPPSGR
jgi:hypothetical protein